MATPEETSDAYLALMKAETDASTRGVYLAVANMAVQILNDKHAATGRNVESAVNEAVAVYRGVEAAMKA